MIFLFFLTWLGACQPEAKQSHKASQAAAATSAVPQRPKTADSQPKARETRGGKRHVAVYLDGEPIAALRYGEMPRSVPTVWVEYGVPDETGQRDKQRCYRLADYLESLGLDILKLKTILLAAGRASRLSHIAPQALLKHREDMFFAFTGGTRGGVEMRYSPTIKTNDVIDKLLHVYLYQHKSGPIWNKNTRKYEFEGKEMQNIPHLKEKMKGGTRIVVDGRIAAIFKRKKVLALAKQPSKDTARVSVKAYLDASDIALDKVKRIDVVEAEKVAATLEPAQLDRAMLVAKAHSGGRATLEPGGFAVQALLLHTHIVAKPADQHVSVPEP